MPFRVMSVSFRPLMERLPKNPWSAKPEPRARNPQGPPPHPPFLGPSDFSPRCEEYPFLVEPSELELEVGETRELKVSCFPARGLRNEVPL